MAKTLEPTEFEGNRPKSGYKLATFLRTVLVLTVELIREGREFFDIAPF